MSVTIKQIAEVCGISRGTVDRVLNGRGKVKAETEKMVLEVAEQLGYKPNFAAKALAARKKFFTIGIVLASLGNPFFDDVLEGIHVAGEDIATYGISLKQRLMKGYSDVEQLLLINEIEAEINFLLINPINSPLILDKINQLTQKGIPVITINTDIENSNRLCYVGSDYGAGGKTACGMMNFITSGKAKIGIVQGSANVLGHNQRYKGFKEHAKANYPGLEMVTIVENEDDDIISFDKTRQMLLDYPEIDAVFIAAGGAYGACRAVEMLMPKRSIKVVCFDSTTQNKEMMKKGIVQVIIDQEPFHQGYKPVHLAFEYLVSAGVDNMDSIITKNEIVILENLGSA